MSREDVRYILLIFTLAVVAVLAYQFSQNGRYQPVICGPTNAVCDVIDTHTGEMLWANERAAAESAKAARK